MQYSDFLRSVIYRSHDFVRNRKYLERRDFLESSQWWTPDQIRAFQWNELTRLLETAFQSVPFYREKYKKAGLELGDIRTWEDFSRIPVLTRSEVDQHRKELCSQSFREKLLPHSTGGSTGQPVRFFITYESYDWRMAGKDRAYGWAGLEPGDRSLHLWGAPVGKVPVLPRLKERLHEAVDRRLMCNTFSQTEELWNRIYERAVRYRPKVIVGYVSSLDQFASYLAKQGGRIPGLRSAIAAAEPLFLPVRERIASGLGVPVYNTYGSREFMSLAAECECHDGLHVNAENIVLETQCASDEPSEIIVTDLHNFGMPFIRYGIGDLGLLEENSRCACGRGLARLKSVAGRELDSLKTPDGRVVPGEFFPHLLKEVPEVIQFQVGQTSRERLVISAVCSEPLSEPSHNLLETEIRKVFGPAMKWELRQVENIPRLKSGKRRVTVGLEVTLPRQ